MNLGVRALELDVHYFDNALRIGHCGGIHIKSFDKFLKSLKNLIKRLGIKTGIKWDTETIGCNPSLSGLPAKDSPLFIDALSEVQSWIYNHPDQILLIYLDDENDLPLWHVEHTLVHQIKAFFGDMMYTPNDHDHIQVNLFLFIL